MGVKGSTKARDERKPKAGQTLAVGRQMRRLLESQGEILGLLRALQEQQTAIGRVVVNIAEQMAEAEGVEEPNGSGTDDDRLPRKRPPRAGGRVAQKSKGRGRKTA